MLFQSASPSFLTRVRISNSSISISRNNTNKNCISFFHKAALLDNVYHQPLSSLVKSQPQPQAWYHHHHHQIQYSNQRFFTATSTKSSNQLLIALGRNDIGRNSSIHNNAPVSQSALIRFASNDTNTDNNNDNDTKNGRQYGRSDDFKLNKFKSSSSSSSLVANEDETQHIENDNHQTENSKQSRIETSKNKLGQALDELGLSISQWNIMSKIISNSNPNTNVNTNTNTKKQTRRKRQSTRRVSEEFDIYNHQHHGYDTHHYKNSRQRALLSEKITSRLRVRSVHAAQTIDIVSVLTKVFGPLSPVPSMRHMFGKTSVIIQLPSVNQINSNSSSNSNSNPAEDQNDADTFFHPKAQPRFIAIFRYGSIVYFNISPKDASQMLTQIKKYSTEPIARSFETKEHFEIAISPEMEQDAHVTSDFALVKELNINNVAVMSTIMAQTVAFDSYNDVVDELLVTFDEINSKVKQTGNFTAMQKETLFKVVAQNNSLFIDMIAKLGIKDRSDAAWNLSQYERVHEGMRNEFEIESRFEHIEFKLNLIQQNAKFFLEILHNQKSDTLEWIIIVLIGFECILMILDMSGLGHTVFDFFSFNSEPATKPK